MLCPLCGQRKARRGCPALGRTICAVCCGTKRLTEIDCPSDCAYLVSAREHPAAVVRRQQERDLMMLLPTLQGLSERQQQLFLVLQTVIVRHTPDGFVRLTDDDVAEAAASVAGTLETSARGVIYEHTPQALPAQRLALEIRKLLADVLKDAGTRGEREAAAVLRSIEKGAREARTAFGGDPAAYLGVIGRLLPKGARIEPGPESAPPPSSLIVP